MINSLSYLIFALLMGYYFMSALQWYSYKFERIVLHYTKPLWHFFYFILPLIVFDVAKFFNEILCLIFAIFYLVLIIFWAKKLDKKLVFTARIKRFFAFYVVFLAVFILLYFKFGTLFLAIVPPLFLGLLLSYFSEYLLANKFKKMAKDRLNQNPNLKIILITASFGKTSMKNFLFELLNGDFKVHKTPRSVNTLAGIIRDINENLSSEVQIYIAEAGARNIGDIAEISNFLNPQIVIVGEVGEQHIEYFKTIENIRKTKLEALQTNRLEIAFLHSSTKASGSNLVIYDEKISSKGANLDGLSFEVELDGEKVLFESLLLGSFNSYNLTACILVANYLKIDIQSIKNRVKNLKNVEHRLQKIIANGKTIIDDSFNGNFAGMSSSYDLISTFSGRKIILTPGIIEADESQNIELGKKINAIFDLVILTNTINKNSLTKHINSEKLIILNDKSELQKILLEHTKAGDLILFSNDAPTFI